MSKVEELADKITARFDYHVCSISRKELVREVGALIQAVRDEECEKEVECPSCGYGFQAGYREIAQQEDVKQPSPPHPSTKLTRKISRW